MKQTFSRSHGRGIGLIALCLLGLWQVGTPAAWAKPKARKLEAGVQVGNNGARANASADAAAAEPESPPPAAATESEEPPLLTVTPAAATEPEPAAASAEAEEIAGLQTELTTLMDDLVQARTRAALIGKTLFKTQVRVHVQNLAGADAILSKIVLKLDGAPIFRGDGAAVRGDEERQVFEGFLAPGPHVLTAEVEQTSRDDSAYGYSLRETYKFQAIRDKRNELSLVLKDYSDVASEFPDDQDGEYDIRTTLRVRAKELSDE